MWFQVLGPVEVRRGPDGPMLPLGGPKQRAMLALLVAAHHRLVSVSTIVDELWGDQPPAKAVASVHSYVANLRRILSGEASRRSDQVPLLTRGTGYLLNPAIPNLGVDAEQFERLVSRSRQAADDDPAGAVASYEEAEALWRGEAYADVASVSSRLSTEAVRLSEIRLAAADERTRCELRLGRHETVIATLESRLAAYPTRESTAALLALALYRAGRQAEALATIDRARKVLDAELGLSPGPGLRRLEIEILRQDESLELPSPASIRVDERAGPTADAPAAARLGAAARLVGRRAQLETARNTFTDVRDGHGRVLLVSGEPGIGKTTFAGAVVADAIAAGLATGWGGCAEAGDLPGLLPLQQMTESLLSGLDPERGRALRDRHTSLNSLLSHDSLGAATEQIVDIDTATFRRITSLSALIREIGPSVLVVDDIQWADGPTLTTLRSWVQHLARVPTLLVLTIRSTELDISPPVSTLLAELARTHPVRIPLGGLDRSAAAALIAARAPLAIGDDAIDQLYERSGGNPFFLTELAELFRDSPTDLTVVPDGIRDVVRRRLSQLPARVAPYLETAAALGSPFDPELAELGSGLTDAEALDAADHALSAGLLVEPPAGTGRGGHQLAFAHALVRDAVLAQLSLVRRRGVHRRIAVALEQRRPPASGRASDARFWSELAWHSSQAGRDHAAVAAQAALTAGRLAARAGDVDLSARMAELGADCVRRDLSADADVRRQVVLALATARKRIGQSAEAWQASLTAAELALADDDPVAAAEAIVAISEGSLWSWREYQSVDREAVDLLVRLLTGWPANRPRLEALLRATWAAEVYYAPEQAAAALDASDRALALIRPTNARTDLVRVLELRHVALERPDLMSHRLATAEELVLLGETAADQFSLATALIFRGRDRIEAGQAAAGIDDYERSRAIATRLGYVPVLVALAWWDVSRLISAGRFSAAEQAIDQALVRHARTTLPGAQSVPLLLRAVLSLARGTLGELADELLAVSRALGVGLLRDLAATALLAAGRGLEAEPLLTEAAADPPEPDYLWLSHQVVRCRMWAAADDRDQLAGVVNTLEPYAGRVVIGGTGICVLGTVDQALARARRALGEEAAAAPMPGLDVTAWA